MTARRRRIAAVGLGLAAATAAVTANLVLLGQVRPEDPMGRLSPALGTAVRSTGTAPAPADTRTTTAPATTTTPTVTTPRDGDDDKDHDHDGTGGDDHDDD
ncbi:MAG: hypothetical protein IT200_07245 [Thermoleophilia bacterium]|nr:hypothetical protein [Thermoleophilia bacterium]